VNSLAENDDIYKERNMNVKMELTTSISQKASMSQKLELKQLLELSQNLRHPTFPNPVKGIDGLKLAHEILQSRDASGILIGGLSERIWSRKTRPGDLLEHKDVDVLVLNSDFELENKFEGGIDWWLPRTGKITHSPARPDAHQITETYSTNWWVNGFDSILRFKIECDKNALKPGLHILDPRFVLEMRQVEAESCVDSSVNVDETVLERFGLLMQKRVKTKLPGFIRNAFNGFVISALYDKNLYAKARLSVHGNDLETMKMINKIIEKDEEAALKGKNEATGIMQSLDKSGHKYTKESVGSALSAGLYRHSILDMFKKINGKCLLEEETIAERKYFFVNLTLKLMPACISKLGKVLAPLELACFLNKIIDKDINIPMMFYYLGKSDFTSYTDQTIRLFEKAITKSKEKGWEESYEDNFDAYDASIEVVKLLPGLIKNFQSAEYPHERLIKFIGEIIDLSPGNPWDLLSRALPAALHSKMSKSEIISRFSTMMRLLSDEEAIDRALGEFVKEILGSNWSNIIGKIRPENEMPELYSHFLESEINKLPEEE
jgi:hypothetical protein